MSTAPDSGEAAVDASDDMSAFSKFYIENAPRLTTFLVCQGVPFADAADCVHETLIDALPPVWATLTHPYAWCRTVAYRKACTLWKRRELPMAEPDQAGSPLITPDQELETCEQNLAFLHWLGRLEGPQQRAVLVWTYDGATPREIAEILEMNPATVRSTLSAARAALRRIRQAEEGGAG